MSFVVLVSSRCIGQVAGSYGRAEAQTIVENCGNTLILRCSASEGGGTARFASSLIGEREVTREQTTKTRGDGIIFASGHSSTSTSTHDVTESPVLASQIEQLPDLQGYVKFASQPGWSGSYDREQECHQMISSMWTPLSRSRRIRSILAALTMCVSVGSTDAIAVGQWTAVKATPALPANFKGIGRKLLLSDGSVMAHVCTNSVSCGTQWFKLTPDLHGSYVNGTWSTIASMHYERANYSSVVLSDGRVFVIGGEQTNDVPGGARGDVYDPKNDSWTLTASIPIALFNNNPGTAQLLDSPAMLITGGRVMLAPVFVTGANDTLIYDPAADSWSAGASFRNGRRTQDESSWVKLPDDSIIVPDNDNTHSERYIPSSNQWVDAAPIPASMQLYSNSEMGPGLLLPNGRAVFFGGTGHTVLYSPPSGVNQNGSWSAAPDIPSNRSAADDPAAMMVNGKILLAVGQNAVNGGSPAPTWFYEFDPNQGASGTYKATSSPGNTMIGSQTSAPAGNYTFLALPDGTILSSQGADATAQLYVYTPDSPAIAAAKPRISGIFPNADGNYHLSGTQLNGISAGAAFGDDAQMDSNYPLIRLSDDHGLVTYVRTYNWSSSGVATGSKSVATEFELPVSVAQRNPGGKTYSLVAVANGISSDAVQFVAPLHFNMERWTGAWGSDGPIFTGDLNGDGKTDVFMWRDSTKSWTVNLSNGHGFDSNEWKGAWGSDGPVITGDFNGDGKMDVMMWRDSTKSWTVNLSNGHGFDSNEWKGAWGSDGPIFTGDLNGDGKSDVFMWRDSTKSWTVNLSNGHGFDSFEWKGAWGSDGPVITGDFNGDGKMDVMMWRDSTKTWTVNLSNGHGFDAYDWKGAWGSDGPIFTGDLNGDGKTDVFMWRNSDKSWTINLSTGSGFVQQKWAGAWGSDGPAFTGNLNTDHKKDVFMWRKAYKDWTVNLSTGTSFVQQSWKGAWGSDGPIFTGDLNGDGKTDVFMWRDIDKSWTVNLSP